MGEHVAEVDCDVSGMASIAWQRSPESQWVAGVVGDAFRPWSEEIRRRTHEALERLLQDGDVVPAGLNEAIRYAVFSGGKRVRAMLCHAAGELVDAPTEIVDQVSAVIEMVHVYSLIQDDLPAMDNDDLRHGVPALHARYDVATALLVCDALITLAFQTICELSLPEHKRVRMAHELAVALGSKGMTGGQFLDIVATGRALSEDELAQIRVLKTGALIRLSLRLGAWCGNASFEPDANVLAVLARFGNLLGHGYQVLDDILDVTATAETIGKTSGKDLRDGKSTYATVLGVEGARAHLQRLRFVIDDLLASLGDRAGRLRAMSAYLLDRGR
jgi:farnesyl diphosphate synthase